MSTPIAGLNLGRSLILFRSEARALAQAYVSGDQDGTSVEFLHVIIDVTAVTATPALTVRIQGKDPASGKYYDILVSTAIATAITTVLKVGPGLTAAANLVANDMIPAVWRVTVTHGDTDSATYSVGASLG
jgi:hypothetical protein